MTTAKQDQEFLNSVVGIGLLESSLDWIKDNMSIDEVFGEKKLLEEAASYDPESIFNKATLETWAEDNGYTKE